MIRLCAILAAASVMLAATATRAQAPTPLLPEGPQPGEAPPVATPAPEQPPRTITAPQPLGPAAGAPPTEAPEPSPATAPPPPAPAPPQPEMPAAVPPGPTPPAAAGPMQAREFCNQQVSFTVVPRDSVPAAYRSFVGIFSDAAWTPQLCAALIVENVSADGVATIIYAYGSMGTSAAGGGVLNGTGVIRRGELKFQNSDGTQFSFTPFYSDLDGHLVTPRGKAFETIFKRTF